MKLIVVRDFLSFKKGDEITEPKDVDNAIKHYAEYVVAVNVNLSEVNS